MSKKDEFEVKLNRMTLRELKQYRKELDKEIKQRILANQQSYPVYPLMFIRTAVDYEIKSRTKTRKNKQ